MPARKLLGVALRLQTSLISDQAVECWAQKTRLFFIISHGRSGTAFLARLLNEAPDAVVMHEPCRNDGLVYQQTFHSEDKSREYIHGFRRKDILLRVRNLNVGTYGEVNSLLRHHVVALREAFPQATFLHLVRDGRDVVRSMAPRTALTSADPVTKNVRPIASDPWRGKWDRLSRFEKLCWYWQVENRHVRETVGRTVKFEKLVGDYDYFRDELLTPLGLGLSERTWQEACAVPQNATREHSLPDWRGWDRTQHAQFQEICGEEMAASGYPMHV